MLQFLFEKLGLNFSWIRKNSPTFKNSAKDSSIANSGNHSQVAGRDIINNVGPNSENAVANEEAWDELLMIFTKESSQKIISNLKEKKILNGMQSQVEFVQNKFKAISINADDLQAAKFIEVKKRALGAMNDFIDEEKFFKIWEDCRKQLVTIKNHKRMIDTMKNGPSISARF